RLVAINFNGGAFGAMDIGKKFFLLGELQYSQKGYQFGGTEDSPFFGSGYWGSPVLSLNYLTMPIMAGLKVGKRWEFLLGPELGFLIRAGAKNSYDDVANHNLTDEYNRFDLGAAAGIRCHLSSRSGIEVRYILGLIRPHKSEFTKTYYYTDS